MRPGLLRAGTAGVIFAQLVMGTVPLDALRAQSQSAPPQAAPPQSGQQTPQQNPPVTVPAPSGEKQPDQ